MEIYRILFTLILLSLFALILTNQIQQLQQQRLFTELQETNLRIARLESAIEESIHKINAKNYFIEEIIDDMATEIHDLQSLLSKIKDDSLHAKGRLILLEGDVDASGDEQGKEEEEMKIQRVT
ncbi:hypothetical protein Dsin_021137 [Dipteronia sinensis]|uniref:Uncharacterized protein n=1 Tax=Dipteronia sinensis TaxID=43782 RepID=A0AAE0ABW0_9ROSI|nr:hypothetical protein Dsin_021137 [Dipteronia sinensis]